MKPMALLAAVRERHPEAIKKEVVRAAFYALAEGRSGDHGDLHSFALTERTVDDDEPVKAVKLRKKRRAGRPRQRGRLPTESRPSGTVSGVTCKPLLAALDAHLNEPAERGATDPAIAADVL